VKLYWQRRSEKYEHNEFCTGSFYSSQKKMILSFCCVNAMISLFCIVVKAGNIAKIASRRRI
jgi:hypothetical protein